MVYRALDHRQRSRRVLMAAAAVSVTYMVASFALNEWRLGQLVRALCGNYHVVLRHVSLEPAYRPISEGTFIWPDPNPTRWLPSKAPQWRRFNKI